MMNEKKVKKLEDIIKAEIVISDFHIPYHNSRIINCSLEIADYLKHQNRLKSYIINGDLLDCYAISKFVKNPQRVLEFQKEINLGKEVLKTISDVVGVATKKYYTEGNHEYRIQTDKKINAHLYSLEMYSIPNLLSLDDLGFEWVPFGKKIKRKNYVIYHGDIARKHSSYTAKAELENNGMSGITGHTHRGGIFYKTDMKGITKHMEGFCACKDKVGDEYIKGTKNWQPGFSVVYENQRTGQFQFIPIEYKDGGCIFEGKLFKG